MGLETMTWVFWFSIVVWSIGGLGIAATSLDNIKTPSRWDWMILMLCGPIVWAIMIFALYLLAANETEKWLRNK